MSGATAPSRPCRRGSCRRCTERRGGRSRPSTGSSTRRLRGTTDSPLYLHADGGEESGLYPSGAFHAIDVVIGLESLADAVCHVLNLLEKRLHRLLDARFSGLPDQLTMRPGVQAGVVALHKTVAGLAAEARVLAMPASHAAIDTSSGQEDVQSFTFLVAERVGRLLDTLEESLACELVALRQAAHLAEDRVEAARSATWCASSPTRSSRSSSIAP